jgi:hypothetical protein
MAAVLAALGGLAAAEGTPRQAGPAEPAAQRNRMTTSIEQALSATGPAYEAAEEQLIRAVGQLGAATSVADPVAGLALAAVLSWQGPRAATRTAALQYLENIERRLAGTAVGSPPPVGVANDLTLRFGDGVSDLMAVRLAKSPHWPRWKTFGALLYLEQHKPRLATAALLRFAVEAADEEARELAVSTLRDIRDPDLASKLQAERTHQAGQGRSLDALAAALKP